MATLAQVKEKLAEGWIVQRASWDNCKVIRAFRDSDMEFFANDFNTKDAIIQECNKPCDCNVGIWIPENGDLKADDYIFLTHPATKQTK